MLTSLHRLRSRAASAHPTPEEVGFRPLAQISKLREQLTNVNVSYSYYRLTESISHS